MKELVTIQDSPKHKLLRAYDSDLRVQNPIGEARETRRQQPDEAEKQQYNQYVKDVTPTHELSS